MSDILLRIENLKTWIGSGPRPVRAVDGVDLEICRGETFALLGESGCGKSMTALSIMRLLPPAGRIVDGHVELDGVPLLDLPEVAMRQERGGRMGMIFQEPMTSLNPVLTIGQQIAEAVRVHEDPARRRTPEQRVLELLEAVGIPDPKRRVREYPHQLSGGMKQRVMIAIALAGRPELLIADEPTTALDVTIQAQVLDLMRDLQRERGMAILLITHDLGVVSETADRVAVMYAGQIVEIAPADTFFGAARHPYSRKLFESLPRAERRSARLNVIEGNVPPLDRDFTGCRFADRCDLAEPRCHEVSPEWTVLGEGEGVRCHLYAGGAGVTLFPRAAVEHPDRAVSQGGETLLETEQLKVHFPIHKGVFRRVVGHVRAVDGVSLAIPTGRTVALVGESGCGKTTVGKGILQLIRPTAGQVRFDGEELTRLTQRELRRRRRNMQIIFQDPMSSMNPRMLVGNIVEEGMQAQRMGDRAWRRRRVTELLEHVGIPAEARNRYPHEFSGGQRQRICVARALALEPKLIVCDEPTSALDVSVQAQILNLLQDLQAEFGLSYLFITHDISVVSYLAHEVAVMYLGRIVERGTVQEVLEDPLHPYTQALLSAVPTVDKGSKRKVIHLEGDMPSPANPPAGCHFHPRCPVAMETCRTAYPPERRIGGSRVVSCFRVTGETGSESGPAGSAPR